MQQLFQTLPTTRTDSTMGTMVDEKTIGEQIEKKIEKKNNKVNPQNQWRHHL
jgi:hypothetical protein